MWLYLVLSRQIVYFVCFVCLFVCLFVCTSLLARHSERGKKTRQTDEVGRHQGMDRPGVCQVTESSGEQGKVVVTGCKSVCGAPTTLAGKG